jgi:hypothetical protein
MGTKTCLVSAALAVSIALCAQYARAEDSSESARAALASLERWLGSGANGQRWAKYLDLPTLHAQLDKGNTADPSAIDAIQKQLSSGAPGLELAPFARLRDAIRTWSEELAIARAPGLPEAAAGAEASFRPVSDVDVQAAKAELQASAAKLDRFLKASGANGAAWKEFLRWKTLQEHLASPAPDAEVLKTVHQQFASDHNGLEMPVFADVGAALERYINGLSARKEDLKSQYATQIKGLADELKQYDTLPNGEVAFSLGSRLGWMENMRQAMPLVRAIRTRYSHPNAHVRLSSRLVAAGIERPVDEVAPVRDLILGTSISGTGHTTGKIAVRLVPTTDKATMDTVLQGTVRTRTVGYNGPATVHSVGTTEISGNKRIVMDEKGLASYPAQATAKTKTEFRSIAAGRKGTGIVQKIATRKAYQLKGESEKIAADHAAARVRTRVESEAAHGLSQAHWNYVNKMRNPLLRRSAFPPLLRFSTQADALFLTALQANRYQIAAPNNPPSVAVESDLAAQVHESAINNLAAALLSGVTIKEEDAQKQAVDLLGKLPEQLKSEGDRDPWSITFARLRPVTVKFADNGVQITIRGQRFTSGERDFQAMNVTADYKIERDGERFRLVRKDELQIEPPNFVKGRTLSGRQVALKTLLEKRFGKIFEREIKSEGLVLPGRWREAGRLDPKQLQATDGWLVAAWIESGEPAPAEDKVAQTDR